MIDKNYCIAFGKGKYHFEGGKSGGLLEMILNQSLSIKVIPNFENHEFKYPPDGEKLEIRHELDQDYKSKSEHRYNAFYTADIVFYVDADRKGTIDLLDFTSPTSLFEAKPVVYFIDELTHSKLVYEIRDKFPFFPQKKRRGGKIWKDAISKSFTVQILDEVVPKIADKLSIKKQEVLGGKYLNSHIV